jgi:hypothetical protein
VDGQVRFISSDGDIVGMLAEVVADLASDSAERVMVVEGHGEHGEYTSVLQQAHPMLDVEVIKGGQMLWPYIVGVE